jgi:[ribosomal protein S5]-alanine N-acetyltransferase
MKIPRTYQIHTERCILRCVSEEDIPYVFSASRYQGFNDGLGWEAPKSVEELYEPLQKNLLAWDEGVTYAFTIECNDTGAFIGRISILKEDEEDFWAIGYWTHPEYQCRGYMTEVARAIVEFGFKVLAAKRIEGSHALWNTGSKKVLKNTGMKFVCNMPRGFQKHGKWVEVNLMAIEREDWLVVRRTRQRL